MLRKKYEDPELKCTCSKSTTETLEKGLNMFGVNNKITRTLSLNVVLVLKIYLTLFSSVSIIILL